MLASLASQNDRFELRALLRATLRVLSGGALLCSVVLGVGGGTTVSFAAPTNDKAAKETTVTPAPPHKALAPHSRKVEDEPQGIALSAPAPEGAKGPHDLGATARKKNIEKAAADETSGHKQGRHKKSSAHRKAARRRPLVPAPQRAEAEPAAEDRDDAQKISDLQKTATPEAEAALTRLAAQTPHDGRAEAALAQLCAAQGRHEEAFAWMWKAIAAEPQNDQYRLTLAILYDRAGHTDQAVTLYRQIEKSLPDNVRRRLDYLTRG